jgi:flavodoxin I
MFYGLALDYDNQEELTGERIEKWVAQVKKEFGI